tara:strand:- start:3484 stop:3867 length:384 start_codon:yes stop_codon:yes gene_type:complete
MAARYVEITLEEMQERLSADKGWKIVDEHAHEYIFAFDVPSSPDIQIKVCSSIRKSDEVGRSVGKDAIRVLAILLTDQGTQPLVKTSRVYRTKGWRDNLKNRVVEAITQAKERESWGREKLQQRNKL